MTTEPQTLGEVVRRVDSVEARLNRIPDIYLRKDVYVEARKADVAKWKEHDKDHAALDSERASDSTFRRQVLLWGAGLTITTLVTIALFVSSIMLGKV